MKELPENVKDYLLKCSHTVGENAKNQFFERLTEEGENTESPIEQLFHASVLTVIKLNGLCWRSKKISSQKNLRSVSGAYINVQKQIGKYRVDAYMFYTDNVLVDVDKAKPVYPPATCHGLIVELDGHEFHERDEKQRRYEKSRDRFFQRKGIPVFHYTGSEVFNDPMVIAIECVSYITGIPPEELTIPFDEYLMSCEVENG